MLLSIVIPTYNRQKYAKGCVDSLIEIASDDVEILVSDSSISTELSDYVALNYSKKNINVLKPENVNNAVENFNYAIDHAKGHYVLILGDDDTLLPNVVDLLFHLKEKKVDAIKFNFPYEYFWDDCYENEKTLNKTIKSLPFSCYVTEIDSIKEAISVGSNLGHGVLNMPRAYLGVISRPLIDRINSKYGSLFGGVSPDIYSSLLISYESEKTVLVDYPVIIPGSSGASTSGKSVNGKHVSELMDNDHLTAFPNLKWDERIPEFYSTHTVWAFSYLQASNEIRKNSGFIFKADFYRLYIKCFYSYRSYAKHTYKSLRLSMSKNYAIESVRLALALMNEFFWMLKRGFNKLIGKKILVIESVGSLSECRNKVLEEINSKKLEIIYKV